MSPSNHLPTDLQRAVQALHAGDLSQAGRLLAGFLGKHPAHPHARHLAGVIALKQGSPDKALKHLDLALKAMPEDASMWFNKGLAHNALGNGSPALKALQRAYAIAPDMPTLAYNLGRILVLMAQPDEALQYLERATMLNPHDADAWVLLGNAQRDSRNTDAAITSLDQALALRPDFPDALAAKGLCLIQLSRHEQAISLFKHILVAHPGHLAATINLANALLDSGRRLEALDVLHQSEQGLKEHFMIVVLHARALAELGEFERSRALLDQAVALDRRGLENYLEMLSRSRLDEFSHDDSMQSISINPEQIWISAWLNDLKHCIWDEFESKTKLLTTLVDEIIAGNADKYDINPFQVLGSEVNESQQIGVACHYSQQLTRTYQKQKFIAHKLPSHDKIRVGYLSADFRNHPVAYHVAPLFAHQDRSKFEISAYSLVDAPDSAVRNMIKTGVDHFHDVENMSHKDLARKIRNDGIDILVDLTGFTAYGRSEVMAMRPAPIQAHFHGFPGKMCAPWIDYMIGSTYSDPLGSETANSEKLALFPDLWTGIFDWQEPGQAGTRGDHGLPEDAFVFACFQRHGKIDPLIFDAWMKIIKQTPDSVLWLLKDKKQAATQVRIEEAAERCGVSKSRLIFTENVSIGDHIARQSHADLFLNTRLYSGSTVTALAYKAGLPMLTLRGHNHVTRIGSAFNLIAGLDELVVDDLSGFIERGIELAHNPHTLKDISARMTAFRSSPTCTATRVASNLDGILERMWARHLAGAPRESFVLATHY